MVNKQLPRGYCVLDFIGCAEMIGGGAPVLRVSADVIKQLLLH